MHGQICLFINKVGDKAQIQVQDSGIGIPDSIKNAIWERFTAAGRKGTQNETSTGLGLSIAKELVAAHQGKIWFESSNTTGTIFFIEIPIK